MLWQWFWSLAGPQLEALALRYFMALVCTSFALLYEEQPPFRRQPKSRRTPFSKLATNFWGYLKSWIYDPCLSRIATYVESMKTDRRSRKRTRRYVRAASRLQKLTTKSHTCNWARQLCLMTAVVAMTSAAPTLSAHQSYFDSDSFPIKIDNCATKSISPSIDDFIGPLEDVHNVRVKGIGGTVTGVKRGTIRWYIEDDLGKVHTLLLPNSYHIPSSPSRLLSPQHWAQVAKDNAPKPRGTWCATYDDEIVLHWKQRTCFRRIRLDPSSTNVATIYSAPGFTKFNAFCAECDDDPTDTNLVYFNAEQTSDNNNDFIDASEEESDEDEWTSPVRGSSDPLTTDFSLNGPAQPNQQAPTVVIDEEDQLPREVGAEFLRMHHKLNHTAPARMQLMAKQGILPRKFANCKMPICTSCLYGKATRRPWRDKGTSAKAEPRKARKPGDCVSIDQLESTTPGLVAQMKGRLTTDRYLAATVFTDHYSGFSYVHIQRSTSSIDTVEAKEAFERYSQSHGIRVRHYHADNGRFADNLFKEAVRRKSQTLSFCGVNAHWQNGVAEKRIRDLQDLARTMMIHANRRWPEAVSVNLWPYALRMANNVLNATPSKSRTNPPVNAFTGTKVSINTKHFFHFGCPVYVLDSRMQAGKKIGKWEARKKIGVYLGQSAQHAQSVALVLSLTTGLVSPQFHVTLDSSFQTLRNYYGGHSPASDWQAKARFNADGSDQLTDKSPNKGVDPSEGEVLRQARRVRFETPPDGELEVHDFPPPQATEQQDGESDGTASQVQPDLLPPQAPTPVLDPPNRETSRNRRQARAPTSISRSGRKVRIPQRFVDDANEATIEDSNDTAIAYEALVDNDPNAETDDITSPILHHYGLQANGKGDPDTMYYHQAMKAPDKAEFLKSMEQEVLDQEANQNWKIVHKSKVPQGIPVHAPVWAMRRKRRISTREVYKWKSRLNFDGSKQVKGVNYWESYAPVASWSTIRLVLTMVLLFNWSTVQIDYVQAFPQADVECDNMFMKVPRGFELHGGKSDDHVLQLQKNVYGQVQAGRVWNKHLVTRLKAIGFKQSKIDECLFFRGKCLYVLYTDDSILTGPTQEELLSIVKEIKSTGLKVTVEGDIGDFLGVNINHKEDGTIELTQPHLIDSILQDLRLDRNNPGTKDTPAASSKVLRRFLDTPEFDRHFDYRSVIGKINYLEKSTRPDISFATHACARFASNPRQPHGEAIKWLGKYLLATKDKGLILKPGKQSFDCFVDASFGDNWNLEEAETEPDTAKSRTGFVINYANCPIIWKSTMQTTIALSSTEAEYIACSNALREVISMMQIVRELKDNGFGMTAMHPKVHCKVFEDNTGAISMVTTPKMRPRTKHINHVYHHFRHHVANGDISIVYIKSENQPADMFTHACNAVMVAKHRLKVCGW